jgi:hypothetical protein
MTVLWLSKDESQRYVCDLVFVVAEVLPFLEALHRFRQADAGVALDHFLPGIEYHFDYVKKSYAKTFVADMATSYVPHPAVELEPEIDEVRLREQPGSKPLRKAWGRQTTPLVIRDIDGLCEVVATKSRKRIAGPLPAGEWIPGRAQELK